MNEIIKIIAFPNLGEVYIHIIRYKADGMPKSKQCLNVAINKYKNHIKKKDFDRLMSS